MKKLLLFFVLINTTLFAQNIPQVQWERTFGGKGMDETHDVLQSIGGNIVLVGETEEHSSGNKDGLFVVVNAKGESVVERIIGNDEDDVINAITELDDGNFVVAGYRGTKAGRKGWVVKLNSVGGVIWEKEVKQSNQDEFYDVIQTSDGNLVFVGVTEINKNKDVWIVKTDAKGTLLWQRAFGAGKPDGGRKVVETADKGLAIGGFTDSKGEGKTDFWLVKTDSKGALLWDKTYGFNKWEEAYSMIQTTDGGFFMVGYNSLDKFNIWVVRTDKEGNKLWDKEYGGSDFDEARAVTETYDGGFMIAGSTRSHRMGARNTKLWLLKVDSRGRTLMTDAFYGGKWNDKPEAIIQTVAGDFVVAGSTASHGMGKTDSWAFQVNGAGSRPIETNATTIETELIGFEGNGSKGTLNANEQGILKIKVANTGNVDAFKLEGGFRIGGMVKGIVFPDKVNIGLLKKGTTRIISIPVVGLEGLQTGKVSFTLNFQDANGSNIPAVKYQLKTAELPKPNVVFTKIQIEKSGERLLVGMPVNLRLEVQNIGKATAKDVKVDFKYPKQLVAKSSSSVLIPNLDAGGNKTVMLNFEIDESYTFRSLPITCILHKSNGDTLRKLVKIEIEKPKPQVNTEAQTPTVIRWYSPDIDFHREKPLKLRNEDLYIKLKVESPKEYEKKDFVVLVDGKPYQTAGSKFDEAKLTKTGKNRRQLYTLTYESTLAFDEERIYEVMLQLKEDETVTSEVLKVAYSNEKPNLYVLSVGTKTNLEYTMQDAKDFAQLYQEQSKKSERLFGYVEVKSVLGADATASRIIEEVEKLQVKYITEDMTSNDMLIIFMSSHGFMLNDEFYIQGDNYRTGLHRSRAVQFSEMMEILNEIKCKKLIFVDACHSGGAKGVSSFAINKAIKELNTKREGTTTIVSSDRDELSYEDKAWENGAFTEGILQALRDGKGDVNQDNIVSINELFSFISKQVPNMVEEIKRQSQTPQMVREGLGNVGIYIFDE